MPLANSATQTTATNRPTYLKNRRLRIAEGRTSLTLETSASPARDVRSSTRAVGLEICMSNPEARDGQRRNAQSDLPGQSDPRAVLMWAGDRKMIWAQCAVSFDDLVGANEEILREGQPDRLRGLEVESQFEFRDMFHRQISRLCA